MRILDYKFKSRSREWKDKVDKITYTKVEYSDYIQTSMLSMCVN